MQSIGRLFGTSIDTKIPKRLSTVLSLSLFLLIIISYFTVSYFRHVENPNDKIVPNITQLAQGVKTSVSPDSNGDIPILEDTLASLERFFTGVVIASAIGIFGGVFMGVFPIVEALLLRFVLYLGKVPPLALLPIIFVFSGLGETTKIILVVVGIAPSVMLDIYLATTKLPAEQLVKAMTFNASRRELVFNIVLPQIMPSALNTIRISLLSVWLFVIAGESAAASAGLGFKIFLVRRYMSMDIIIPYVLWIATLAFLLDFAISWWIRHRYGWYGK